jgi:hypothetical protein
MSWGMCFIKKAKIHVENIFHEQLVAKLR